MGTQRTRNGGRGAENRQKRVGVWPPYRNHTPTRRMKEERIKRWLPSKGDRDWRTIHVSARSCSFRLLRTTRRVVGRNKIQDITYRRRSTREGYSVIDIHGDHPGCPRPVPCDRDRTLRTLTGLAYFLSPTAVTTRCRTTKTRIMRPTTMVVHSAGTPKSVVSGSMIERTRAPSAEPRT